MLATARFGRPHGLATTNLERVFSSNRRCVMTVDLVRQACEMNWHAHRSDCSGFVRAVAGSLKVGLTGNADSIVDQIVLPPWTVLSDMATAAQAALSGKLVIGGLKGAFEHHPSPHGHVVVLVGGTSHEGYPLGYWGKLGGVGAERSGINYAWRHVDLRSVTFASRYISML